MLHHIVYVGSCPKNTMAWKVSALTPLGEEYINRVKESEKAADYYVAEYNKSTTEEDKRYYNYALMCELDTYDLLVHRILHKYRAEFLCERVD